MRLGGRLQAAIDVLEEMQRRHRPAADALKDWGLSHRFAGSADRAAIGNIVYDALRRRRSAHWIMGADTSRAEAFGALLLEAGHTVESLDAALDGDRFAPAPLDEGERTSLAKRRLADAPDAVRADCPDWCVPHVERSFGSAWVDEVAEMAKRPPLDLRVNTLKADRERIVADLRETGAQATDIAPDGIRIPPIAGDGRHPNVQAEEGFQKGWFEVQDEGSQIVARLSGARPGMQVLDYCAGGGGKTLALSAAMEGKGQVFAFDAEKQRLAPIYDRVARAGAHNVQIVSRVTDLAPLEGTMDIVLIDAPCTGAGTWRRRPDAKWRLTDRQLGVRVKEQSSILEKASVFVRPGGLIVYITCSVFAEENADRVEAFRSGRTGFGVRDPKRLWTERFPVHPGKALFDGGPGLALSPLTTGTDGFYFSALSRET